MSNVELNRAIDGAYKHAYDKHNECMSYIIDWCERSSIVEKSGTGVTIIEISKHNNYTCCQSWPMTIESLPHVGYRPGSDVENKRFIKEVQSAVRNGKRVVVFRYQDIKLSRIVMAWTS